MIPYLHEKMQEIRWIRFLENLLTNQLTDSLTHSLTHSLTSINYYNANLKGPCLFSTGVQNPYKKQQQCLHSKRQ